MLIRKNKLMNKNIFPFFLLAVIHFIMLLVILKRNNRRNMWILLLSNMGFAYLFEYIILNLFHGYRYKPSIFKNRSLDSIFGAILSQGLYVPISATFLTLYKKKWYWKITFSFIYFFIEKIFIRLNVYSVYWWRPIYTLVLLNIYFIISDSLHKYLMMNKKWALSLAHFLGIEVIGVSLMYISAVKRQIKFGRGKFKTWREHFMIAPLYSMGLSLISVKNSSKSGMHNRMKMLMYSITADAILSLTGVLKLKFRQVLGSIPFHLGMIGISRFLYLIIFQKSKATS